MSDTFCTTLPRTQRVAGDLRDCRFWICLGSAVTRQHLSRNAFDVATSAPRSSSSEISNFHCAFIGVSLALFLSGAIEMAWVLA